MGWGGGGSYGVMCRVNGAGWGKGIGVLIKEMKRATY